uniref:Uncharacterized protein n=1 Tax=Timema tahoe TaxID=61484 RepID=A0A7R9IHL0_9NEOP|nr:unnamed protein product [Timema tahoe]
MIIKLFWISLCESPGQESLPPASNSICLVEAKEDCYNSMACIVASKGKMFCTQTKQLWEVTWRTVALITKKYCKSAAVHLTRHCEGSRAERIYSDWLWWILKGLPFNHLVSTGLPFNHLVSTGLPFNHLVSTGLPFNHLVSTWTSFQPPGEYIDFPFNHLVRVMDCFFNEGIKVFYRVSMAVVLLFYKHSSPQNSEWMAEILAKGVDSALNRFCKQLPVTPTKLLRTAFGIRALSSAYIQRVFVKTEMTQKSRQVITGSRQLVRSRSSDNLPTSQSQVNIQMMSRTLTIREVRQQVGNLWIGQRVLLRPYTACVSRLTLFLFF